MGRSRLLGFGRGDQAVSPERTSGGRRAISNALVNERQDVTLGVTRAKLYPEIYREARSSTGLATLRAKSSEPTIYRSRELDCGQSRQGIRSRLDGGAEIAR